MPDRSDQKAPTTPVQQMICAAGAYMGATGQLPDAARIAAAAGMDPADARRLFPDDAALGAAVMETVFIRLTAHVGAQAAAADAASPAEQYRAFVQAALGWLVSHPDQARVLLRSEAIHALPLSHRYYGAMDDACRMILGRAAAAGQMARGLTPEQVEFSTRAMTLGLITLVVQQTFASEPQLVSDWGAESAPADAGTAAACAQAMDRHLDSLFPGTDHTDRPQR